MSSRYAADLIVAPAVGNVPEQQVFDAIDRRFNEMMLLMCVLLIRAAD